MALTLRAADAARTVSAIKLLAGGSLRPAKSLKMMRSGVLVTVATFGGQGGAFALSPSPDFVFGGGYGSRPTQVLSDAVTVTPTGGVSPYTYAWTRLSGSPMTILSPTAATTRFQALMFNSTYSATMLCTATSASGSTATCLVSVELYHEGYSGNGPIP